MNSKKPLPNLTEQQWAQQDLFIDGLVHFLDVAGNLQDKLARRKGLQLIHVTFLRKARIRGYVSFDRIRADLETPRYTVSRAAALLVKRELGGVVDLKSDARYRRFTINKNGRDVINGIDFEIARQMGLLIQVVIQESRRYCVFTNLLSELRSFLPYTGVTKVSIESAVEFYEPVTDEDIEEQKYWAEFAVKSFGSKTSVRESIVNAMNLLMVNYIDPKRRAGRVRTVGKEDVFPPK